MRLLRFLSRLAFICNICFLLLSAMQYMHVDPDNEVVGNIIILGYFGPMFVNFFVNLIVVILFVLRRIWAIGVPRWLLITNFIFFILQILLFYHFNHSIQ